MTGRPNILPRPRTDDVATRLGLPQVIARPKQQRAQDVLDNVVDATIALLRVTEFEGISVADIANRAHVSVGTFYTRFPSREHILAHIARDHWATLLLGLTQVVAHGRTRKLPIHQIAETYFRLGALSCLKHGAVLRPLLLIVKSPRHTELRQIVSSFDDRVHSLLRERVLAHKRKIRHDHPKAAVDFAILAASTTIRECFVYGEPVSHLSQRHRALINETARLFSSYLLTDTAAAQTSPLGRPPKATI
jgi:AcrR family transcriptional regulator